MRTCSAARRVSSVFIVLSAGSILDFACEYKLSVVEVDPSSFGPDAPSNTQTCDAGSGNTVSRFVAETRTRGSTFRVRGLKRGGYYLASVMVLPPRETEISEWLEYALPEHFPDVSRLQEGPSSDYRKTLHKLSARLGSALRARHTDHISQQRRQQEKNKKKEASATIL